MLSQASAIDLLHLRSGICGCELVQRSRVARLKPRLCKDGEPLASDARIVVDNLRARSARILDPAKGARSFGHGDTAGKSEAESPRAASNELALAEDSAIAGLFAALPDVVLRPAMLSLPSASFSEVRLLHPISAASA